MHFARGFAHTRCFCLIIRWHCKRCHAFSTRSVQMGEKMDKLQAAMEKTLKENFSVFQPSFHIDSISYSIHIHLQRLSTWTLHVPFLRTSVTLRIKPRVNEMRRPNAPRVRFGEPLFFCAGIRCLCLLANQCVEMIWDDFGVIIPEAANDERFHALPVFFKFMFVSRNQKISIHSTHSGPLVTWHLGGWSLIVPMNCCRRRSWANVTQRSCF